MANHGAASSKQQLLIHLDHFFPAWDGIRRKLHVHTLHIFLRIMHAILPRYTSTCHQLSTPGPGSLLRMYESGSKEPILELLATKSGVFATTALLRMSGFFTSCYVPVSRHHVRSISNHIQNSFVDRNTRARLPSVVGKIRGSFKLFSTCCSTILLPSQPKAARRG
jgi:hypothetical protein